MIVEQQFGEGRQTDEKVQNDPRIRVQGSVVEGAHVGSVDSGAFRTVVEILLQIVVVLDVVIIAMFILLNHGN